jgi:hypothetical protein
MTRGGLRAGRCRTVTTARAGQDDELPNTPAFGYIVCCA